MIFGPFLCPIIIHITGTILSDKQSMELTQAQLNSIQSLTVSTGKIKADNLAVGQQIVAKVAAINSESGEISLKINDTVVTLKARLPVNVGQTLQLTITQSGAGKVVLQLPQTLLDAITSQKALREALPKQQPLTDTLIQLKSILSTKSPIALPDKITQLARNIVNHLPTPAQLSTASGVKQAIVQSGVFLESKLATLVKSDTTVSTQHAGKSPVNNISHDIKSMLMNLKQVLVKEKTTNNTPALADNKTPTSNNATSSSTVQASQLKTIASVIKQTNSQEAVKLSQQNIQQAAVKIDAQTTAKPQAPASGNIAQDIEGLKYKKIIDTRNVQAVIENISSNQANTTNNSKQLSDKQIQQILNNLIRPGAIVQRPVVGKPTSGLTPLLPMVDSKLPQQGIQPVQHYTGKPKAFSGNDINIAAIKSQHVSEATAPRMNNLVDLIETLIKQVDSAISRTQIHQLSATHDPEGGKLAMSMEIPVNDDDNLHLVQLHIEKEPNSENETETVVTVNLAIDLDKTGPVYARITLINEMTSVVFWAEREDAFQMVEQSMDILQGKLEKSGLKSDKLSCHHGQPPQNRFVKMDENSGLLDVRV